MTAIQRKLRQEQLDVQLGVGVEAHVPTRPRGGWVQAIREALGMSLEAFGSRLGISRQNAHQLERAENRESISIKRLRSAAEALDCELVIYLKPRCKLESFVLERARVAAREIVAQAGHSMAMEDQAVSDSHLERLVEETATDLINRGDRRIWQGK